MCASPRLASDGERPADFALAMADVIIRKMTEGDAQAAARVFYDAVHFGACGDYNEAQRTAWAPVPPRGSAWRDRLLAQHGFVAEQNGAVVGFMTLRADGYLDFAYVAPSHIGKGVAKQLYVSIVARARELGLTRLTSEASYSARRFFERQGWRVVKEQTVTRGGVSMTNFAMEKGIGG